MATTLYLNPDVLRPPHSVGRNPRSGFDHLFETRIVDATTPLEQLLLAFPQTEVVLHSYSVKRLGYRHVVEQVSPLIRSHIIGSTYAGNRLVRFRSKPKWSRRDWLRADVRRRAPEHPVVVDSDETQILPELAHVTLIVTSSHGLAAPGVAKALFDLLLRAESSCGTALSTEWLRAPTGGLTHDRCIFEI